MDQQTQPAAVCSKCGGQMTKGYPLDFMYGGVRQQVWANKLPGYMGLWAKSSFPKISAYACDRCGFLESYVERVGS